MSEGDIKLLGLDDIQGIKFITNQEGRFANDEWERFFQETKGGTFIMNTDWKYRCMNLN